MLSVHSSFSVKTFALAATAAGGDSESKKTRNRRSKEERKSMVESFIKKYQNTNNGKYPSLNLTHKEVGGSFYTVREIVREIIQENRVLAPGNLNSKALNLAYYPEEDISTPLSIATIDCTTDQEQGDGFSFKDRDYLNPTDSEILEVDNNSFHLASCEESKPNITMVSQQVNGKNSGYLEGDLDNDTIDKESNLTIESEVVINENPESVAAQISGNAKSSVPSCESMVNVIINTGNQSNSKAPIIDSLSAGDVFLPILNKLPETNLSVESVSGVGSSNIVPTVSDIGDEVKEEFVPFGVDSVNSKISATEKTVITNVSNGAAAACPDAQTSLGQDSVVNLDMSKNIKDSKYSSEQVSGNIDHLAPSFDYMVDKINDNGGDGIDAMATEISSSSSSDLALTPATSAGSGMPSKSVLDASLEDRKKCYFVDFKEALLPPGVTINNISANVTISSNLGDETLEACHGTQHSHELDPFIGNEAENIKMPSTIAINEPSSEKLNLPELQSSECKELENTGSVVQPLSHANNMGNAVTKSSDEACQLKNKVEKQNCFNSGRVTNTKSIPRQSLPRQSLDMKSEKTTENPFWAAIKSIFNAVSKFLTE